MTTETILTLEQIHHLWDTRVMEPTEAYPLVASDKIIFARAIEQAVLQSPEIQELRRDAELYRTLRKMRWNDSPLCVVRNPKESVRLGSDCPSDERLDLMILAAMEQQA